jgi:hypothetical protein
MTSASTFRSVSGILIAFLALLIALSHRYAMEHFLYWSTWWFDVAMHVAGGVFFGAGFSWLARYEVPHALRRKLFAPGPILLAVFFVGAAWEVFEVAIGIAGSPFMPYLIDTLKDLADDIIGGAIGYMLLRRGYGE